MKYKLFIDNLNDVIEEYEKNKRRSLNPTEVSELFTRLKSAISRLTITNSPYEKRMEEISKKFEERSPLDENERIYILADLNGVARSLRTDIEKGLLNNIIDLIHADSFADLYLVTKELLDKNYKDAAAVIIGTSLELHLKNLCKKHGISLFNPKGKIKKAAILNNELYKINIYGSTYHKEIIAWQDLRNKAAHGNYGDYNREQVDILIQNITNFVKAFPA